MSKQAKDYPVTFPYGSTAAPYSPSRPHLGDDRAMPLNTEVWVLGTLIGLAGTTGYSTGVHTHEQKVSRGMVVNPNKKWADVKLPARVFEAGYANNIGNFVRIVDANGDEFSFFHLNKVSVKVNDYIKENYLSDKELAYIGSVIVRANIGQSISKREAAKWLKICKDKSFFDALAWVKGWKRYKANIAKSKAGTLPTKDFLMYTLRKDYKEPNVKATELKKGIYEVK